MIKIKDVNYDLCDRGPAIAHPVIIVDFENVDSYDGNLFEDFKKIIEEKEISDAYNDAINYNQSVYFLFKGRIFEKDSIEQYRTLFTDISKDAANLQKALREAGTINAGQMKPPFFMWEGIPQDFTGVDSAYNDFNVPYSVIDKDTDYSPIALQQIMNHPFGTVFISWKDKSSGEFFKEILNTYQYKCFLTAKYGKAYEEAKEFALKNKCCLYIEN